ncbi:patatin-like phospholipase family protein [Clostridioides difficile]
MKIGLVLAGGGSRGAYQIGVWKALIELGIDKYVEVVSGTSIGALNAMLFLQGDYNLAEDIWNNLTKDEIMPLEEKDLIVKGILFFLGAKNMSFIKKYIPNVVKGGTISREGLNDILEKIDFDKIKNSKVKGYATCTSIPEIKAQYFNINEHSVEDIKKILYATSAVPLVYDSPVIEDISYLDGGIVDNIPIQPVYGESCDIIIIVQLEANIIIDRDMYPNTNIIEINSAEGEGPDLKGMMDFDTDAIRKRITKGYKDTIYKIKPIMDMTRYIDKNQVNSKGNMKNVIKRIFKK